MSAIDEGDLIRSLPAPVDRGRSLDCDQALRQFVASGSCFARESR